MSDEAENQVNAFLEVMRNRYGLSDSALTGIVAQLIALQRRTEFARRMGEWTAKSIIVVLVGAFFSGFAWAFVHFIKGFSEQ